MLLEQGPIAQTHRLLSAILLRCVFIIYIFCVFQSQRGSPTRFSTLAVKLFGVLLSPQPTLWQSVGPKAFSWRHAHSHTCKHAHNLRQLHTKGHFLQQSSHKQPHHNGCTHIHTQKHTHSKATKLMSTGN